MTDLAPAAYHVAKFGGTSVADAERMRAVVALVTGHRERQPEEETVVVTSAMGGVTDDLLAAVLAATGRSGEHRDILARIRERHYDAAARLAAEGEHRAVVATIDEVLHETEELLQGIYLLRECTPRFADAVVSAGERLAAPLLAAAFRAADTPAVALDARELIRTDEAGAVDRDASRELTRRAFDAIPIGTVPVVTGFIAATADGVTTTLGRSGSDYTATLLAAALQAREVVIWTDVDGVLSADPRIVPEAFTLERLTYREAAELAHFGAKVLHPRTMRPLERAGIPLVIKNTGRPEGPGTAITHDPDPNAAPIRALTAVRNAALITLEGAGLLGVPDLTARAFAALTEREVPVLLIAQASSEGSLCFAVPEAEREDALRLLHRALARECERGDLHGIHAETGLAVIAAVGQGLRQAPGLAGKMFATLARARINVRAIAEGASDHNLSCVVSDDEAARAVGALHEAFALRRLRAHLVLLGIGTVGGRLLNLLAELADLLLDRQRVNLRLVGVARRERLLWEPDGQPFAGAEARLASTDTGTDVLDALGEKIREARLERLIIVDATGSGETARHYDAWLAAGAAVVTPNQHALAQPLDRVAAMRDAARQGEAPLLYETTVGAGLSVLNTLRDLVRTGDHVRKIYGVLSGTLAHVFHAMREGRAFSEAVREASALGYTESDPRADLAGEDVRRKLLILGREMGLLCEPSDVQVQSLVPDELADVGLEEFWERLPDYDEAWDRQRGEYASRGQHLQYVGLLAEGEIRAGVQALSARSPLAKLRGASVMYAFHTDRYGDEPLVVQGPGANADVTASVLLADIVRAAEAMR
jgi:bifunctional aspartokinase / homoserine dehydrogenase 1